MMNQAEQRDPAYLFKIKPSARIKELLTASFAQNQWPGAGQGWQGMWSQVPLAGGNGPRRVILLRRPLRPEPVVAKRPSQRRAAQMERELGWIQKGTVLDGA